MSNTGAPAEIEVFVNGESRRVPAGSSLAGLLETLGVAPDRIAVELNRNIVRRSDWPSATLEAGARIEIVQFVGGG
jgi:thiamine biosynthesis protein ThiS